MSATKTTDPPVQHDTLEAALAAFQAELPAVHKGATGQVPGKRVHKYADLADLSLTVLPLLGKHGLSWVTMPLLDDQGRLVLRYELAHASGSKRTGDYPISGSTEWDRGSSLTYARRYCLSAVTGVAADDDDDGAAANAAGPSANHGARPPRQPAQQPEEDTVQAARSTLASQAKARKLTIEAVDAEYQKRSGGTSLAGETSPAAIRAFIDGLNNGTITVGEPKPAGAES